MKVDALLHHRVAGSGAPVVCLHASGSSSSQWQQLMQRASPEFGLIAVDLLGHGGSPAASLDDYSLVDERAALANLLRDVAQPVHLVGHSYGAAVALDFACRFPHRVRALTLYEPVLFGLLAVGSLRDEVETLGRWMGANVAAGRYQDAAQRFIDYWGGRGSWEQMPARQRDAQLRRIPTVARHFDALLADPVPEASLRKLSCPVTLIGGQWTKKPAAAITERLAQITAARWIQIPGAGHMGPITHEPAVSSLIVSDLQVAADHPILWARAA